MPMSPRLLRPRATGFNPKSISGLAAWYDASNTASITLNGSTVSQWSDLSGNGNHATQSTANNQPAYTTATLNGKAVLTFSGSPRELLTSLSVSPPFSVIAVVKENASHVGVYVGGNTFANIGFGDASSFGGNKWAAWGGTRAVYGNASASVTTNPTIVQNIISGTSFPGDISIFANGAGGQVTTYTSGTAPGSTLDSLRIGHRGNTAGEYWVGYIAEVLVYSRALAASERAAIDRGLGRKWGITVA